jgi:hypothetical protein
MKSGVKPGGLRGLGQLHFRSAQNKKYGGVFVADVLDKGIEKRVIVGEDAALHIVAEEVAEDAAGKME